MKYIKKFEMLFLDKLVIEISDYLWTYVENALKKGEIIVEVKLPERYYLSDTNIKKEYVINLMYDVDYSVYKYNSISLGVKNKDIYEIKSHFYHEITHIIQKNDELKNVNRYKKNENDSFYDSIAFDNVFKSEINNYELIEKKSFELTEYLNNDRRSDKFKKLLLYLYLSDRYENKAFLHGYYAQMKDNDNFKPSDFNKYKYYVEMQTFAMKWSDFKQDEKDIILSFLKDKKYLNQLQKLINNNGVEFILASDEIYKQ